jgi:hypothetical protein
MKRYTAAMPRFVFSPERATRGVQATYDSRDLS